MRTYETIKNELDKVDSQRHALHQRAKELVRELDAANAEEQGCGQTAIKSSRLFNLIKDWDIVTKPYNDNGATDSEPSWRFERCLKDAANQGLYTIPKMSEWQLFIRMKGNSEAVSQMNSHLRACYKEIKQLHKTDRPLLAAIIEYFYGC